MVTRRGKPRNTAPLDQLERLRAEFGPGLSERKRNLLDTFGAARFARAGDLLRYHDALCFLRAYPDDREVLGRVERQLAAFETRPDLARHARALENSGVAGTPIRFRFFDPMAQWLAGRWPDRLKLDWADFEQAHRLDNLLTLFAAFAESPALDEYDLGPRAWIDRLRGPDTDAAFVIAGFRRAFANADARERMWDEMDPPIVLEPGPDTPARGREALPWAPRAFQRGPLERRRPDLVAEAARPPDSVRPLPRSRAERVIDLARSCMVTRSRDLDVFSFGDPGDVRLADCGDGLAFAIIGARPERRLLLESVYAFLTLRNGVPIGYVLCSGLFGSAEVAYNVFENWRGAEAGRIYGRVIGTVKQLFGADSFTIYPYQLGEDNDEALESGAWWFYQKLGFRARDRGVNTLMRAELERMRQRPGHRSSIATLKKLAPHNVYWHQGVERDDVIGLVPLGAIGNAVTRSVAARFGADRTRAEEICAREAQELLGTDAPQGWRPGEALAWRRWSTLVMTLPGVGSWPAGDRSALVDVIRAKGGARESEFVARFDAHPRLRAAVLTLGKSAGRKGDAGTTGRV